MNSAVMYASCGNKMAAATKWRSRWCSGVLLVIFVQYVQGYEETFTISQLSPKSAVDHISPQDDVMKTSHVENIAFSIEPSITLDELDDIKQTDDHIIIARSVDPIVRESRSINFDELPTSGNEIDSHIELHNKRKYYDIQPTKTVEYLRKSKDEVILSSENFGDRLSFKFPGEGKRVPKARALVPMGPRIRPTAVQPMFATAIPREDGRQKNDIQNIITGIVKLLNGNVNVQANTQLLNGRPGRPMASRINNRGPPRISDAPLLPEFDGPINPPLTHYYPTKTPPPYPFDRPPHVPVTLPEQIVPPLSHASFHRPLPPWQRPRPRPPNRRPNPGLPMYKPNFPPIYDIPEEPIKPVDDEIVNENESTHSENVIHNEELELPYITLSVTTESEKETDRVSENITVPETSTTSTTTTTTEVTTSTTKGTTTEKPITTTEKQTTTTEKQTTSTENPTTTTEKPTTITTTEKPITTEKLKSMTPKVTTTTEKLMIMTEKSTTTTEKLTTTTEKKMEKPKIDKKKDTLSDKDKLKYKMEDKQNNKTIKNDTNIIDIKNEDVDQFTFDPIKIVEQTMDFKKDNIGSIIEPSMPEVKVSSTASINLPTPTEGLTSHVQTVSETSTGSVIKTTSINSQPLPTSQETPAHPYRPRPGIVLDDTDFKPHGSRYRPEASLITAPEKKPPGYGEIFDVTLSAIQGMGEKGATVHIQNVNLQGHHHDDIIVSPSGEQGFVSIDGKRTYLNLFDSSTSSTASIRPTQVQKLPQSVPPLPPPPLAPTLGTGVAIPADDVSQAPVRRPAHPQHRPQQSYRPARPTVRIDTCIVGDDSTCDQAQNEKCKTESGISSCQCRPGYARRIHRDPCRRVVSLLLSLRVDRLYDRKVGWHSKLADTDSEPYQQLSFEAVRAIDSAFSMTPFSDDFVSGAVNSVQKGDRDGHGVYVNFTILMQETPETLRSSVATDIQKHLLGVIRRRSNNVGASALWVDTPAGSVAPLHDLDECSSPELNDCHQLATCTNTWGGFRCACPDTTLDAAPASGKTGRDCRSCAASHCNERGVCKYSNGHPYCSCSSGYYGSTCEVDGEVVGVAVGASLAAALVIALTLAALMSWSRKWSREQKAAGMGSPIFNYMAANTIKTPPVGQPPYQVSIEERMRWAQIAEAMAQASHYAQPDGPQTMATRPSSALFGGYPTLPPVPMPRMAVMGGPHNGTLNTVTSRGNAAAHHSIYGYTNHVATESTSSEASSHVQERADLLMPRPKSRARSMHNQTGIYYDVEYENTPEAIYGAKGIPLSTYTVSRGPPFYRT